MRYRLASAASRGVRASGLVQWTGGDVRSGKYEVRFPGRAGAASPRWRSRLVAPSWTLGHSRRCRSQGTTERESSHSRKVAIDLNGLPTDSLRPVPATRIHTLGSHRPFHPRADGSFRVHSESFDGEIGLSRKNSSQVTRSAHSLGKSIKPNRIAFTMATSRLPVSSFSIAFLR